MKTLKMELKKQLNEKFHYEFIIFKNTADGFVFSSNVPFLGIPYFL
jgi:hypothetical protein